jgi:tRNA(adenine34) deaminase
MSPKPSKLFSNEYFMHEALREARQAAAKNEVPVGAVIVSQNRIIARAHNMTELLNDVTAHAEILAITSAANTLGAKYLTETTLYVTIEPCIMCAGACFWAQIPKIVYGAADPKAGFTRINREIVHPGTTVFPGVLEKECAELMIEFFRKKR